MNDEDREIRIERQLWTSRIITLALIAGVTMFLTMVLLMPQLGGQQVPALRDPLLTWFSVAAGVVMALVALFFPEMKARQQYRQIRSGEIASGFNRFLVQIPPPGPARDALAATGSFQTRLIFRLALLEGAAFFSLIAYMLERQWPSLMVAVVMMAMMAASFPTRGRLDQWMEEMANLG